MEDRTGDERSGEGMGGVAGMKWRIGQGMTRWSIIQGINRDCSIGN